MTYGDHKFTNSKKRIVQEARNFGFDTCTVYSPDDLEPQFRNLFINILRQPRIGGYGIWRPWLIKKKLGEIRDGDYLCYIDAGCTINPTAHDRMKDYLRMLDQSDYGIISFQMTHLPEKWYTTEEIFQYFGVGNGVPLDGSQDTVVDDIRESGQILDGILIMKKCAHTEMLIDVWLKAVFDNPFMFTDIYNGIQTASYFIDNRHEQSVFSVIRKKYGCVLLAKDETFTMPWGSPECMKYPIWATRIRG